MDEGRKDDKGKPRFSLLPAKTLGAVIDVLEYGANKYSPDNWKNVQDARVRYYDAAHRHIQSWFDGESKDPESGLYHLAHAICCLLFALWFEITSEKVSVSILQYGEKGFGKTMYVPPGAFIYSDEEIEKIKENLNIPAHLTKSEKEDMEVVGLKDNPAVAVVNFADGTIARYDATDSPTDYDHFIKALDIVFPVGEGIVLHAPTVWASYINRASQIGDSFEVFFASFPPACKSEQEIKKEKVAECWKKFNALRYTIPGGFFE